VIEADDIDTLLDAVGTAHETVDDIEATRWWHPERFLTMIS